MALKGGRRLDAHLREAAAKLRRSGTVSVGFLENASYPGGDGLPVAAVAALNEFGVPSRGQPPRPFFRTMVADKAPGWGAAVAGLLRAHDYDVTVTLRLMGEGIAGQLRQSITDFDTVSLAASTVQRKGNDKQLVDSGHMLQSVDYHVDI